MPSRAPTDLPSAPGRAPVLPGAASTPGTPGPEDETADDADPPTPVAVTSTGPAPRSRGTGPAGRGRANGAAGRAPIRASLSNSDPALRPCWHPVARSGEVRRRPVDVRLLGETWTLRRERSETGAATHPGSPTPAVGPDLTFVRAARAGDGSPAAAVCERDGLVFLAPEPPLTELLEVEAAHDPAFLAGWLAPLRARVGAGLMTDNFLDMAHFPFVHAATIGAEELTAFDDIAVVRQGLGMTVRSEHQFANHEDPGVAEGLRPLIQRRRVTFAYRAPFSSSLRIEYLDAGGTNVVVLHVQPEDELSCRLYSAVYRDDLGPAGDRDSQKRLAEAVRYETLILAEDLALQTRYRDLRLPLDLRTEVHVRADAPTIELRRILADLVTQADRSDQVTRET